MTRRVLVVTNGSGFMAQELPAHDEQRAIERIVECVRPRADAVWQVIEVPDDVHGRDVTRYAETVTRPSA